MDSDVAFGFYFTVTLQLIGISEICFVPLLLSFTPAVTFCHRKHFLLLLWLQNKHKCKKMLAATNTIISWSVRKVLWSLCYFSHHSGLVKSIWIDLNTKKAAAQQPFEAFVAVTLPGVFAFTKFQDAWKVISTLADTYRMCRIFVDVSRFHTINTSCEKNGVVYTLFDTWAPGVQLC